MWPGVCPMGKAGCCCWSWNRRGRPKMVETDGYCCPNPHRLYYKLPTRGSTRWSGMGSAPARTRTNTKAEMQEKANAYIRTGTRLLWVVYPRSRTVYVYVFGPLDEPSS
jgi:hypothetical protein